jgi:hypothetical protein
MLKIGMIINPNRLKSNLLTPKPIKERPLIYFPENELISNESAAATSRKGKPETSEL